MLMLRIGGVLQVATLVLSACGHVAEQRLGSIGLDDETRLQKGAQRRAARGRADDSEFIDSALQSPDANVRRIGEWLRAAAKALAGASEGSEQKAAGEASQHLAEAERVLSQLMQEGKGLANLSSNATEASANMVGPRTRKRKTKDKQPGVGGPGGEEEGIPVAFLQAAELPVSGSAAMINVSNLGHASQRLPLPQVLQQSREISGPVTQATAAGALGNHSLGEASNNASFMATPGRTEAASRAWHLADLEVAAHASVEANKADLSRKKEGLPGETAVLVVAAGEPEDKKAPELADGTADAGQVKAQAPGWLDPEPKDLEDVLAWVKELAEACGYKGETYADRVTANPGVALTELKNLARTARLNNDGVDRDAQALGHLLELKFEERRTKSHLELTKEVIGQIADDFRRLSALRALSPGSFPKPVLGQKEEDLLLSYYRGLSERQARAVGRPKALLLSCSYGDGHKSAAEALSVYLGQANLAVHTVDTSQDRRFRTGITNALGIEPTYIYNNLVLRRQWYRLHNIFDSLNFLVFGQVAKPCPAPECNTEQKDQFRALLLESHPDLIVTVYHMDLLPLLEVAKDLGNIPLLHVATDMDLKMHEVFGKVGPAAIYPRFLVGVPFENRLSAQTIRPLSLDRTFISGYPVRPPFLQPLPPKNSLLQARSKTLPEGTKVALIMTGGGGQDVPWPEWLATGSLGIPLHVVVVIGRNTAFASRLATALPQTTELRNGQKVFMGSDTNVTIEVATDPNIVAEEDPYYIYAEKLAELMDHSDLVITKPGGGTAAELAYRGVPALFDASAGLLHWEEFTVRVFEQAGRGARFSDSAELVERMKQVFRHGRSTVLAADPEHPGQTLDTAFHIKDAARRLMSTPCVQCSLFPEPENKLDSEGKGDLGAEETA